MCHKPFNHLQPGDRIWVFRHKSLDPHISYYPGKILRITPKGNIRASVAPFDDIAFGFDPRGRGRGKCPFTISETFTKEANPCQT